MGSLSACLFLILSFWIPLWSPTVKSDRKLLLAIWATLCFRHGIALINAFVAPISTSWYDLYKFHNIGAGLLDGTGQPYGLFLKVVYGLFGTSFWLGEEASILAYSFSLLLFVEIGLMLGIRHKLAGCVLLYGLMPSPAIHCSVTLRESYQALGFLGTTYALCRLRARPSPWVWLLLGLSLGSMVLMHQGLAVFAVAVVALGVPWALQGRGQGSALLGFLFIALLPMLVPMMLDRLESESATARAIAEGRLLDYAATYRDQVDAARSDYGVKIDPSDLVSFASTTVVVVLMYFLAPLPWQVSSTMDYYAFFEVVVRLALLYGCLQQIVSARGETRQRLILLFAMAVGLEFLWAVGTANWGTALRHHVVAFGAFVLVGLPHFSSFTLDPELAGLLRRRERRQQLETLI